MELEGSHVGVDTTSRATCECVSVCGMNVCACVWRVCVGGEWGGWVSSLETYSAFLADLKSH